MKIATPPTTAVGIAAAAGLASAVSPGSIGRLAAGSGAAPPSWVVSVLGARSLVQGVLLLTRWTRRADAWWIFAAVDGLHASSMVGAAALWPRFRRPALVSAALAAATAAAEVAGAKAAQ